VAEWPVLEELKQRLNVESDEWDGESTSGDDDETRLSRLLAAAIAWAKEKRGEWDEDVDEPTATLAQAALERAVELATDALPPSGKDRFGNSITPKSEQLLFGQRRRFGVA